MPENTSNQMLDAWYRGARWLYLLVPLVWLYALVTAIRRQCYRLGLLESYRAPVPVIVVGNITLGGTGKSPLVSYLLAHFSAAGFKPGVVSRGYGASIRDNEVRVVTRDSQVDQVGDEPLMIHLQTHCPVAVSPRRKLATEKLIELGCNVVIADDGLQHYALQRDVEICVVDGRREFGNRLLLPAGPLRESIQRLESIDFLVCNGQSHSSTLAHAFRMDLQPGMVLSLDGHQQRPLSDFAGARVHAIAGIGNPERFFDMLARANLNIERHAFADHHPYCPEDLSFSADLPLLMTEKDAVKCRHLNLENAWYIPVQAHLSPDLFAAVTERLTEKGYPGPTCLSPD